VSYMLCIPFRRRAIASCGSKRLSHHEPAGIHYPASMFDTLTIPISGISSGEDQEKHVARESEELSEHGVESQPTCVTVSESRRVTLGIPTGSGASHLKLNLVQP